MSDYSSVFKAPPSDDLHKQAVELAALTLGFDPKTERDKWMAIGATLSLVKSMLPKQNDFGEWITANAVNEMPGLKSAAARSDAIWCSEHEARVNLIPVDVAAHPRRIRTAWRALLKSAAKEQFSIFGEVEPAISAVMALTEADKAEAVAALDAAKKAAEKVETPAEPEPEKPSDPGEAFVHACLDAKSADVTFEVAMVSVSMAWGEVAYTEAQFETGTLKAASDAVPPPVDAAHAQSILHGALQSMNGDDVQGIVHHLAHEQDVSTVANMLVGLLNYMKKDECPKSVALDAIANVFGKDA